MTKEACVPKTVLLDEIHLTVIAPRGLEGRHYEAMVRTLRRRHFLGALRTAVRTVVASIRACDEQASRCRDDDS